jgi:hypothetical protein
MSTNDPVKEKEMLKEYFELISANIKAILHRKKEKMNAHDRDFILSAIKVKKGHIGRR